MTEYRSTSQAVRAGVMARCALRIRALLAVLALSACGGGGLTDLAGGVGSGGSGLAEGTISGFGSVWVDGVRYETAASLEPSQTDDSGAAAAAVMKLGQRVRLTTDSAGTAIAAELMPQLIGPIEDAGTFDPATRERWIRVLGQLVRIDEDGSASDAPTVIDLRDCDDSSCIRNGMWVEAHGSWIFDPVRQAYVLRATRLEQLETPTGATRVLVSGVVTDPSQDALKLSAPGAPPAGLDIRNAGGTRPVQGQLVRVWATSTAQGGALVPRRVLAGEVPAEVTSPATLALSGEVGQLGGAELVIQGTRITVPPNVALGNLAAGQFARLEVEKTPQGWALKAAPVLPPPGSIAEVSIAGNVSRNELADARSRGLTVRGTRLAPLDGAVWNASGCAPYASAGAGSVSVSVATRRGSVPLKVTALRCSAAGVTNP